MKKLMFVAAAAAMIGSAEALVVNTACNPGAGECDLVFKVTASGKAAAPVVTSKTEYKTAQSLKIKKGALVALNGNCGCVDDLAFYAPFVIGKNTINVFVATASAGGGGQWKFSIFGKDLEAAMALNKEGASKTVESDLGFAGGVTLGDNVIIDYLDGNGPVNPTVFDIAMASFGKLKVQISKAKAGCVPVPGCTPIYTPKSYSGWFAGAWDELSFDAECFACTCDAVDLFGGTWKANYAANMGGWEKALVYAFGSAEAAAFIDAE